MRLMSTVVFPLPAPASSSSGPSVVNTPSSWRGFIRPNSAAMICRRKAANWVCFSSDSIVVYLRLFRSGSMFCSYSIAKGRGWQPEKLHPIQVQSMI